MESFIVFCAIISLLCCVYFEFKFIQLQKLLKTKELIYSDHINEFWDKEDIDNDIYS